MVYISILKNINDKNTVKFLEHKNMTIRARWHNMNPSADELEAGGLWVQGQPEMHSETIYQNIKGGL